MAKAQKLFYCKLDELGREYQLMQTHIALALDKHPDLLFEELESLEQEILQNHAKLEDFVSFSRSPAVSQLSSAHLDYCQKMEGITRNLLLNMNETSEECAEAAALYAEYAMDFATQTTRFALIAAMEAIILQNELEAEENSTQK